MNFISFLRHADFEVDDNDLNAFIDYAQKDDNFPSSSDPIKLAKYLYLDLNATQTIGFQKAMLFYDEFEVAPQIPPKYRDNKKKLIQAVNTIASLQRNDPNYDFEKGKRID